MIAPTPRAALAAAAGAPLALGLGLAVPELWWAALAWLAVVLVAVIIDALLLPRGITAVIDVPTGAAVGETFLARLRLTGPAVRVETALGLDARLSGEDVPAFADLAGGPVTLALPIRALRRGEAHVGPADLRWTGPLGLVWRLVRGTADTPIVVTPDIRPALTEAPQLIAEDARMGAAAQPWRGEGGDFDTLVAFRPGIDRRRIDWKASARHMDLLAKEFRTERDSNIILALDCGRLMGDPVDGLARIDRATTAALLTAAVALRAGDKVGMFAFDARPQQFVPPLSGLKAFAPIQRAAARIADTDSETNFALSLSVLAGRLARRSLIILFTEFTDTTTAALMLGAAGRLLKRHLVVCVVLKDAGLEAQALARPESADDIARAVVAGDLLRERRLVIARLRRMGIEVVEASAAELGPGLVRRYLAIKAAGRL